MANVTFLILLNILLISSALGSAKTHRFSRTSSLRLKAEKLSHLHFYFHDILSGRNPTAVRIAQSAMTNSSPTLFGATVMIDDPLTVTHEPTSKIVGRAQGFYASASQKELGLLMVLNLLSLKASIKEYSQCFGAKRCVFDCEEMPIVGGSGVFRFARGMLMPRLIS